MADTPNLLGRVYSAADDKALKDAATDYYNLQLDIEKSMAKQNSTLLSMLGLNKEMSVDVVQVLKRTSELHKSIEKDLKTEELLREQHRITKDETMRRELQQSMASNAQRRAAYTAELELLEMIQTRGLLPIFFIFGKIFAVFKSMDKAAWEFRKAMGMTRDTSEALRKVAQSVAIEFAGVGVSIDDAYKSIQALGKEMGGVHSVTKELVKTTALLQAQLGVSVEDSAGFMRNMAAISGSTMEAQQDMAYIAANLSAAGGVPLPAIMKDVAKMSGTTLTLISRVPNQIVRAAIEARRLNTTLDSMAKGSAEILNFSENINAEMEASVLLGRSINLHKARELAYHRDLEGSTKEILRIAKQVNFEKLDYFQMNAFARATGRSVEELTKMIQADKQLQLARTSTDPAIRKQYEAYEAMRASNEASLKANGKNLEMQLRLKANQERLTAITQKWNEMISKIAEHLLPVVDVILSIIPPLMDIGKYVAFWGISIYKVGQMISAIGLQLAIWTERSVKVSNTFLKIAGYGDRILTPFIKVGGWFAKIGGYLGPLGAMVFKFVSPFLKILGPIGWLVTAIQGISGFIKGWKEGTGFIDSLGKGFVGLLRGIIPGFDWIAEKLKWIWGYVGPIFTFIVKWLTPLGMVVRYVQNLTGLIKEYAAGWSKMNLGQKILQGLLILPRAIWMTVVQPFINAYQWIVKKLGFGADSPSKLGLSIVGGIVSVGAMVFDALISPWRGALTWIGGLLGNFFTSIVDNAGSITAFIFKWLTPIGLVIQGVRGLLKLWDLIGPTIKQAFSDAWNGIKNWFGFSPSQVGLSIVKGIVSVGAMVFDALTSPWRNALAWIFDKIPGMGKVAEKLRGGIGGILNTPMEAKVVTPKTEIINKPVEAVAAGTYVPAVTVTPKKTVLEGATTGEAPTLAKEKEIVSMADLLKSNEIMIGVLNGLREDLNAGKIGINMDGQLLSATLARQTEFRNGYGTNTAR